MNLGTGNQTGDISQRDAAGRDITYIGASLTELALIMQQFTDRIEAYRDQDIAREERRNTVVDIHNGHTQQAIEALRIEQYHMRQSVAGLHRWLIGLTLVLVIVFVVVFALAIDRTILNPIIGAVLSLTIWRLGIRP